MRWMAVARVRQWASDSMTQGPAMRKSCGPPMVIGFGRAGMVKVFIRKYSNTVALADEMLIARLSGD